MPNEISSMEPPSFTPEQLADFIYEHKIPEIYRIADDEMTKHKDLFRYLHVAVEGGFGDTLEKAASMKALVDPITCPEKYLPYLYASWGLPYFEDIGVYYNRKFLANIGTLLKRRGTMGGVRFMVRVLTGMECTLRYKRKTEGEEQGRYLYITLIADTLGQLIDITVPVKVLTRFLSLHIPFYIRAIVIDAESQIHEVITFEDRIAYFTGNLHNYDFSYYQRYPYANHTQEIIHESYLNNIMYHEGLEVDLSKWANVPDDGAQSLVVVETKHFNYITSEHNYGILNPHTPWFSERVYLAGYCRGQHR